MYIILTKKTNKNFYFQKSFFELEEGLFSFLFLRNFFLSNLNFYLVISKNKVRIKFFFKYFKKNRKISKKKKEKCLFAFKNQIKLTQSEF